MKPSLSNTGLGFTVKTICPACDQIVDLGKTPKIGQAVNCVHCGESLDLVSLNPLRLIWNMFKLEEMTKHKDMNDDQNSLPSM